METIINNVLSQMQNMLDPSQLKHLAEVLPRALPPKKVSCLRRTAVRMDFRLTDVTKVQTVKRGIA